MFIYTVKFSFILYCKIYTTKQTYDYLILLNYDHFILLNHSFESNQMFIFILLNLR